MKTKAFAVFVSIAIAGGAIGYSLSRRSFLPPAIAPLDAPVTRPAVITAPQLRVIAEAPAVPNPVPAPTAALQRTVATPAEATPAERPAAKKAAKTRKPKPEPKDPLSRKALTHVGANSVATSYWLAAINNKSLPAEERADLIEDLNEEGLSDPDNPSHDELPLIISRLQIIALHGPFAMDAVNAGAFAEAYKDLLNVYNRLVQ